MIAVNSEYTLFTIPYVINENVLLNIINVYNDTYNND